MYNTHLYFISIIMQYNIKKRRVIHVLTFNQNYLLESPTSEMMEAIKHHNKVTLFYLTIQSAHCKNVYFSIFGQSEITDIKEVITFISCCLS